MTAGCTIALHERHCEILMPPAQQMAERFSRALQVISCEQARISLDEVFSAPMPRASSPASTQRATTEALLQL